MINAAEFLAHSNFSTVEISGKLGFDSLSHFNHLFKKTFGITPREYRSKS